MSETTTVDDDYQPMSGAERMRRHRERKREGRVVLYVELLAEEISALVDFGFLHQDDKNDKDAIHEAFVQFIEQGFSLNE